MWSNWGFVLLATSVDLGSFLVSVGLTWWVHSYSNTFLVFTLAGWRLGSANSLLQQPVVSCQVQGEGGKIHLIFARAVVVRFCFLLLLFYLWCSWFNYFFFAGELLWHVGADHPCAPHQRETGAGWVLKFHVYKCEWTLLHVLYTCCWCWQVMNVGAPPIQHPLPTSTGKVSMHPYQWRIWRVFWIRMLPQE